jgi:predicted kinase
MTGTLLITRGLPASGKTTWARGWVEQGRGRARVNRDDVRLMAFGRYVLAGRQEELVTSAEQAVVEALLRDGADVVVDDTNLRLRHARAWADLAGRVGARFEVRDFTDVPLEVCLARDAARRAVGERSVGEEVLRDLYLRFLAAGPLPPVPVTPPVPRPVPAVPAVGGTPPTARGGYVPDPRLPPAWIVDVDGTLAIMSGRSPYAWHRVGEDAPNPPVVELVRALRAAGNAIVVVSGRDGVARRATQAWLDRHEIPYDVLLMRARGDARRDSVVKREIFETLIRRNWQVRGVLDDRDQVVRMWRELGLTCAQVAPGDF